MASNYGIPKNAEKILFARDLVSHVMFLHTHAVNLSLRTERYRDRVYNGFNDVMRSAVTFIDSERRRKNENYAFQESNSTYTFEVFSKRVKELRRRYFLNGFDINIFLPYCVHVANLAVYFYTKGVREAPIVVATYIMLPFLDFDVTNGGWETLNGIAERYVSTE